MASLLEMIGQAASPQNTAMGSTPDSLKSMFMPLMESMIRDATLRNDPISRLGDVGLAALDASGGGTPFAKSLAPLDAARQQATGGAMNMFLNVMGLDKQLEQLKAVERRHAEDLAFRKDEAAARRVSEERGFGLKEREFESEDRLRRAKTEEILRGERGSLPKKIAELESVYPGVDRQTLVGVATGTISIITNPQNGNYAITDKVHGTVREITPSGPARGTGEVAPGEPKRPAPGESLYDQASRGTGVWSSVGRIWSDVAGQIHPDLVPKFAEAAVRARSALSLASSNLTRTLYLNQRMPDTERRAIEQRTNVGPDMFTSPTSMRLGMHEIDKFLETQEANYARRLTDPNLSPADRSAWRSTIAAIRDYRRALGANPDPDKLKGAKYIRDEGGAEIWEMPDGALKRVRR